MKLCPGQTVIDVGANVGLFSMFAAQVSIRMDPHPVKVYENNLLFLLFPPSQQCLGGNVYSFEPVPTTFELLECNIDTLERNSNLGLFPSPERSK